MTPEEYLVTLLSAAMCLLCGMLAWGAYRRTREIFSPWTIFLGMAILDIFLPGVLYYTVGLPLQPPWILPSTRESVAFGILLFSLSVFLFGWGYWVIRSGYKRRYQESGNKRLRLHISMSKRRAYSVLLVAALISFGKIVLDVVRAGSVETYLLNRALVRFSPGVASADSPALIFFSQVSQYATPIFLMTIGVLFSYKNVMSPLRRSLLIGLGILAASATLYRGTILSFFIALTLIDDRGSPLMEFASPGRRPASRRRLQIFLAGVAVAVFLGGVRNFLTAMAWEQQTSIGEGLGVELRRVVRGDGLVGLASIMDYYPAQSVFLGGNTLRDMLLLPIPRAIWPDKPKWYGIDDIARGMGWPPSTQSAVTMPGELYANFGYPGALLMCAYGMIFGLFHGYRHGPRSRFIYAFILVPATIPTFWMSFTGFVNQLAPTPLAMLVLTFMFPRSSGLQRYWVARSLGEPRLFDSSKAQGASKA